MNWKKLWVSSATVALMSAGLISINEVNADDTDHSTPVESVQQENVVQTSKYTVGWGDTMENVADALGVDVTILEAIDQNSDLNLVSSGTEILVTSNEDGKYNIAVDGDDRDFRATVDEAGNVTVEHEVVDDVNDDSQYDDSDDNRDDNYDDSLYDDQNDDRDDINDDSQYDDRDDNNDDSQYDDRDDNNDNSQYDGHDDNNDDSQYEDRDDRNDDRDDDYIDYSVWSARSVEEVRQDIDDDSDSYLIKWGDTLSVIAQAFDVDMNDLARANDIEDVDLIYAGDRLTVSFVENFDDVNENDDRDDVNELDDQNDDRDDVNESDDQNDDRDDVNGTDNQDDNADDINETDNQDDTNESITNTDDATQTDDNADDVAETNENSNVQPALATEDLPAKAQETVEEETVIPNDDVFEDASNVVEPAQTTDAEFDQIAAENPANNGLQPKVASFKEEVAAKYGITSFSTYRPGDSGDHGTGLAVDFMVPVGSDLGDQVAQYAVDQMNSGDEDIAYVIWEQRIYGDWSRKWELMEDRGSITANHYDHIHVSFNQ